MLATGGTVLKTETFVTYGRVKTLEVLLFSNNSDTIGRNIFPTAFGPDSLPSQREGSGRFVIGLDTVRLSIEMRMRYEQGKSRPFARIGAEDHALMRNSNWHEVLRAVHTILDWWEESMRRKGQAPPPHSQRSLANHYP